MPSEWKIPSHVLGPTNYELEVEQNEEMEAARKAGDSDPYRMKLPTGKTCSDCVNHLRCAMLFGCPPMNVKCDWSPSRFRPSPSDSGGM